MGKSSAARVSAASDPETVEASEPEALREVTLESVEPEEIPEPSPYPEGTELFSYTPKQGGEILRLPLSLDKPDKVWLWDQAQLPFLSQTWRWMQKAKVPNDIQRKVCALPDDEYVDMFTAWFEAMGGGATPGE